MTKPNKNERRRDAIGIIIKDIAAVCAVLLIFALFHHVLPRPAGKMNTVATLPNASADVPVVTVTPQVDTTPSGEAQPQQIATAEPIIYAPGDFSANFPNYDTGEGALHSYQSDNVRIAITMGEQYGATYYVADVWVRNISGFKTAFAKGQFGTGIHAEPVKTANANNAVFAISGDYCGARDKGVVIRNGDLYRDTVNSDVCVLYTDGAMKTFAQSDVDINALINGGVWQAWGFGPQLLKDGKALDSIDSAIKGKNPRNAMGYYEPGHYCFVTVDGRQPGYSDGMTLVELSALFESLGCKYAFNLDGGATAEMIFQGELVNKPYKGGRQSSDIIYFGEN